jgi:radical SAM superfamily enzyme YgiQ (UPF0313 family)
MAQILIFTGSTSTHFIRSIGAYQVSSRLREKGYDVQVIEHFPTIYNRHFDLIIKILNKFIDENTLWIGFSSTFFDSNQIIYNAPRGEYDEPISFTKEKINKIKSTVRSINNNCKLVLGGAKSSFFKIPDFIDYYVEGYADNSIIDLTRYLENKNPFFQFISNSDGSKSVIYDRTASCFDFSNYRFSWQDADCILTEEALPIEISRGCVFKCSFCTYPLNGKKKLDYIKSPDVLLDEFKRNYDLFGTTKYVYSDDTHNDSVEKLETLYDKVYSKLPFKISFSSYIRLDLLRAHPHTIDLLKESGLTSCFFGIESLNYLANKSIGKGMRTENIIDTLNILKDKWSDIFKEAGFIIGLPNDSENDVCKWLDLVTDNDFPLDRISLSPLRIYKGSKNVWSNLIESDPESYGYDFTSSIDWKNNKELTRKKSYEIVNQYNQSPKIKTKLNWVTVVNMLNNLNTNKEKFLTLSAAEIDDLKNKKLQEYLKKIFKDNDS